MTLDLIDIGRPKGYNRLNNNEILSGPLVSPTDRLKLMDEDTFEDFILEWAFYLKGKYVKVYQRPGSGDKGRDVIAKINDKEYDTYQCKHYADPITPVDVYLEFGKLCYYTYIDEYKIPNKFYIVSPKGIGPKLGLLIEKPDKLREELIKNWEKYCSTKITTIEIKLEDKFLEYVKSFDFSIIDTIEPLELIEQFKDTSYYSMRFGGGLQKKRLAIPKAGEIDLSKEINYVQQLYQAYSDYLKNPITTFTELTSYSELFEHFKRQRDNFYSAESLEQFSRDVLPPEIKAFDELKDEIFEQVVDVYDSDYSHGYERLKKTIDAAKKSEYSSSPLHSELKAQDKSGICHHLANENRLIWVK